MLVKMDLEEKACGICIHYHQHYVWDDVMGYIACNSGHCCYPRLKDRKPSDTCERFEERKENET